MHVRELFGVACFRGHTLTNTVKGEEVVTVIKKWVVTLATRPFYGFLRHVTESFTEAYFAMGVWFTILLGSVLCFS